jgi:hypothetical protein
MEQPISGQNTNDRSGSADNRANAEENVQQITAASITEPNHHHPNGAKAGSYCCGKKSTFDVATRILEIVIGAAVGGALIGVGYLQYSVYTRQAGIMDQSSRAIVFAREVRVEKKDGSIPGEPGKFEAYWWFSPVIENGGGTSTKGMRITPQAVFDPSRPEIEVKLPLGFGLSGKQVIDVSHVSSFSGPPDPETVLIANEELERQRKPSSVIRTILGPHVSQAIAGFGVPIEETRRRLKEGGRWFILGAVHYNDRFSNTDRLSKYCFGIGFEITAADELNPATSPCPHWNCADEECENDKTAYNADTANWQAPAMLSIPPSQPPYPATPTPWPPAPAAPSVPAPHSIPK